MAIGTDARAALDRGAAVVDRLVHSPEPVYGVSTGFGALANTVIPPERSEELQLALIRSHAAGLGAEVEREVVRAMMLLRARSLSMGYSGARAAVVESIVALLNAGITPIVPEYGSLGASGDLAPLASAALVLLGEGAARRRDGTLIDGVDSVSRGRTCATRPARRRKASHSSTAPTGCSEWSCWRWPISTCCS